MTSCKPPLSRQPNFTVWMGLMAIGLSLQVPAQDIELDPSKAALGKAEYSPYLEHGYPDRVYFGDTHLHTAYSTDAGMLGCRLGPDEAYRFARGEEVTSSTGVRARLQRPYDFLVVSDHSENLGLAPMIAQSNPALLKTEFGHHIHDLVKSGKGGEAYNYWGERMLKRDDPLKGNDAITRSMWERITTSAEKYNEPGKFTAFIGFEWTSMPGGNNLHLNPVHLDQAVQAIIDLYPQLHPPKANVTVQHPLLDVIGNESLLSQVVSNLLDNAVKFIAEGITPQVRVWTEQREQQVRLWVQDNGIGINPEFHSRIFGIFERVHPRGRYEGTGIGLAIVRKAVERMGGKVGLESDGKSGARFWVDLPSV